MSTALNEFEGCGIEPFNPLIFLEIILVTSIITDVSSYSDQNFSDCFYVIPDICVMCIIFNGCSK